VKKANASVINTYLKPKLRALWYSFLPMILNAVNDCLTENIEGRWRTLPELWPLSSEASGSW